MFAGQRVYDDDEEDDEEEVISAPEVDEDPIALLKQAFSSGQSAFRLYLTDGNDDKDEVSERASRLHSYAT